LVSAGIKHTVAILAAFDGTHTTASTFNTGQIGENSAVVTHHMWDLELAGSQTTGIDFNSV
jgi:hypothetical protein